MRSIVIEGKPLPKERPKVYRGHAITPTRTKNHESRIAYLYRAKYREEPTDADLAITLFFFLPIPTSWSMKKKQEAETGKIKPSVRPDIDNLSKVVLDGLNGVAFNDDKQIVSLTACKRYSKDPRTEVYIERL